VITLSLTLTIVTHVTFTDTPKLTFQLIACVSSVALGIPQAQFFIIIDHEDTKQWTWGTSCIGVCSSPGSASGVIMLNDVNKCYTSCAQTFWHSWDAELYSEPRQQIYFTRGCDCSVFWPGNWFCCLSFLWISLLCPRGFRHSILRQVATAS
jgi:hypothetical protein